MPSIEQVSAIIGAIYDCVISPERWRDALTDICSLTRFHSGTLGANALPSGEPLIFATVGIDPDWLARMRGHGTDVMRLWGGVAKVLTYPLDEPIVCSQATDRSTWEDNSWYRDWARPQGLWDAVSIVVARDSTLVSNLTFGRHQTAGEVAESDLAALRLIAPHLRRAVTITKLVDREMAAASTFATALEALAIAVILVDGQLNIVHANGAAAHLLASRDRIQSSGGRLGLSSAVATSALRTAVAMAASNEVELGRRGLGIPIRPADGTPCVAHVMPLRQREIQSGVVQRASAAVFVAPTDFPPRLPADALALLYDLTPAEVRVFELIVEGQTQPEIASSLGVATSTVKTHLLRVFDKTGHHSQASLVRLAASVSLPV